ncbi:Carboxylesterase [Lophiotrema nucula]|uniref:Carboxylic ester hydrolase n=1 Tax=Lophiotrema nucula TaxID=690887 RepID=A0A6A5YKT3_9PLEO|nr:Carboxylesterase [Lophiotrema nucula]
MYLHTLRYALLSAITLVVTADEVSDALSATPTATIASGIIIGTTTSVSGPTGSVAVNKFLGIPFAAAPTGDARFSPPQAPAPWTTIETKDFGNSCVQVFAPLALRPFTEAVFNNPPPKAESEDCLYINVFAPKKAWNASSPPYPVMYWMYGGAWKFGFAGLPWYDGSHFAGLEDVIIVSVNYRTNVFGLPQAPTITNLTERNLAMLDQRFGLQWVQDNIHHFGGDKDRVTIFGQSAGAFATDALITSYEPGQPRPFRAGIMESGTYAYLPIGNCNNSDFTAWNALTTTLNCTGDDTAKFNCIKNDRSAAQLKNAQENNTAISFGMACDNITFVSDPRTRLETNRTATIPVILGSNTLDGSFYSIIFGQDVDAFFATYFANNATIKAAALAAYPQGSEGRTDNQTQLAQIYTDYFFHCPAVWYGEASTKFKPTYRYLFNAVFNNTRAMTTQWPVQYQGAWHTSEIPIVFSTYNESTAEASEITLSNTMRMAWAGFAKDPSKAPVSGWPVVGGGGEGGADVMSFGTDGKGAFGPVVDKDKCQVWEDLGFRTQHL